MSGRAISCKGGNRVDRTTRARGEGGAGEGGTAILPVLLLMFLFSAIALGVTLVVRVETGIADRFRQNAEAMYAADAALSAAAAELRGMDSWSPLLAGSQQSALSEGAFSGAKAVPGGSVVSVCCGPGSAADRLVSETLLSPLPSRRTILWQPFLWSTFQGLVPDSLPSRLYVVVWVANDEDEGGTTDVNETVTVRAEAIDPGGLRRAVEGLIARLPVAQPGTSATPQPPAVAFLRWREVR
jgi:hypothetical protein